MIVSSWPRRGRRDLGGEIGSPAFSMPSPSAIAHEAGDLDRAADLAFGFLERLRHALACRRWMNGLLEQADLLVEGLDAGLDDLLDHVRRLALRP